MAYCADKIPKDMDAWDPETQDEEISCGPPPWTAAYGCGFFEGEGKIALLSHARAAFRWGGLDWSIPAVYTCDAGMVVDLCGACSAADGEMLRQAAEATAAELVELDDHHPARLDFRVEGRLNGQPIRAESSVSGLFIPATAEEAENAELRWVLEHYDLSTERAWRVMRCSIPWPEGAPMMPERLTLTLVPWPMQVPGPLLCLKAGEPVHITHPRTGDSHTLTVMEEVQETLHHIFPEDGLDYPTHYTRICYDISPDLPGAAFRLRDTHPGDPVLAKRLPDGRLHYLEARGAAAIGIIGGADGPSAFTMGPDNAPQPMHSAISSLRFHPAEQITWQATFWEMPCSAVTVSLCE